MGGRSRRRLVLLCTGAADPSLHPIGDPSLSKCHMDSWHWRHRHPIRTLHLPLPSSPPSPPLLCTCQRGFQPARPDDGVVELMGLRGGWHAGTLATRQVHATRVGQVRAQLGGGWGGEEEGRGG